MPRHLFFFLLTLIVPLSLFSQKPDFQIKGKGSALYLTHKVSPKENFYSVGRMYNVAPRALASFNQLSMDKGLSIGQIIKVPLDESNFAQSTSKSAAEALVPLYHKVGSGETLFRIGANYGNVPLDDLKKWNKLSSDQLNAGANLIVGYLRVNKSESSLANSGIKNEETPVVKTPAAEIVPAAEIAVVKKETPPVVEEKKEAPVKTPEVTKENTVSVLVQPAAAPGNEKEGFFRSEYDQLAANNEVVSISGSASVFKSTSGWQDDKYYCFNNEAAPGSIVKVSVSGSEKAIYAKVLDAIPDIKQNEGVRLVLSNAAADALGVTSEKFDAVISYFK